MDFITLWISAIISSRQRSALRMSLAAAFGGLYGVVSLFFSLKGALTYLSAAAVSIIMCIIAFGFCNGFISIIKQSALIWGCGALLGGIMTAVLSLGENGNIQETQGTPLSLIAAISVVFMYVIARIITSAKNKRTATVKARFENREVSFSALCDSGNLMRDPLSADAVVPVTKDVSTRLCGKRFTDALLSANLTVLQSSGLSIRVIPRRNSDQKNVTCGFVPDCVTVIAGKSKKNVKCIILPTDKEKNYFAGCSATIHPSLLP